MRTKKAISIVGHFGGRETILDGQTVKTKILYDELQGATNWKIKKVDTYYKRKNPVRLLWQTLVALLTTRDVIVLLSGNGMKFYFPILSFFARAFGTRVYHDVIGGNLDRYVSEIPKFKGYLNSFRINWVETAGMKDRLCALGITNAEVMPNFKRLNCVELADGPNSMDAPPYRFCMFSRVMKEKGIEDAIAAIEAINAQRGEQVCELDIYGRVDDGYRERFEEVMQRATSAVQYRGLVPFDQSVEHIKDYYALLFPTFWDGEGFPGTIIDAFSAGLPVIATDWNCNGELIDDFSNGILYPSDRIATLTEAIDWAIANAEQMTEMKKSSVAKAKEYMPEQHIERIVAYICNK